MYNFIVASNASCSYTFVFESTVRINNSVFPASYPIDCLEAPPAEDDVLSGGSIVNFHVLVEKVRPSAEIVAGAKV